MHRLQELVVHPFWQAEIGLLELPVEPALDAFIVRYGLAATVEEIRMSMSQGLKVREDGKVLMSHEHAGMMLRTWLYFVHVHVQLLFVVNYAAGAHGWLADS